MKPADRRFLITCILIVLIFGTLGYLSLDMTP